MCREAFGCLQTKESECLWIIDLVNGNVIWGTILTHINFNNISRRRFKRKLIEHVTVSILPKPTKWVKEINLKKCNHFSDSKVNVNCS
ncbi:MAG: hypothetical protein ACTS43_00050 [Candidatus Hodgkinia cicadicola]